MGAITRDRGGSENGAVAIWGGVECTVNRVGDTYFDQLERNGHALRLDDLRAFADLGIRTLRFPLLWERTAPDGLDTASWAWADERMGLMRELGIRPIVGLVHHGSGPRSTSLLDARFGEKLAEYARAVAERYPWVDAYTPINEPLTTARFSGLYGLWYPHARHDRSFALALMNECRATSLAMRAVREINPSAQLVQTEDLGLTHSTPQMRYQARFENHRRWLTFDLLRGQVDERHPLWKYLRHHLQTGESLAWMRDNPSPPDIIGLNYYVTSERYLDENIERYPGCAVGGNRRHRYVDVEAVRVLPEGLTGPERLLRDVWERYQTPIAVTEAHIGCARPEQMRWLRDIHAAAQRLRGDGVDIRAVTAWALLGTFDWNCLVTRCEGFYESGVFDVRGGSPRPTALAHMVRSLAAGETPRHPVLEQQGWWTRSERLLYPTSSGVQPTVHNHYMPEPYRLELSGGHTWSGASQPSPSGSGATPSCNHGSLDVAIDDVGGSGNGCGELLIAGATGTLGRTFARICRLRGIRYRILTRDDMDIADADSVARALDRWHPWALVNAAGFVRVDDAEIEADACYRENADGPAILAAMCARRGIALATFSSDLVFDGRLGRAYVESDEPTPLGVYGHSKARAEMQVQAVMPGALVVRTSAFFGPHDDHNFVTQTLRSIENGIPFVAADDMTVSPTYVPDLVDEVLNLLLDGESGIWHVANDGATTWYELARTVAERAGLDGSLVIARPLSELGLRAARPLHAPLASERAQLLPTLDDAIARYFIERDAMSANGDDASDRREYTEA